METSAMHRAIGLALVAMIVTGACTGGGADTMAKPSPVEPRAKLAGSINVIGHEPLFGRGMNDALAASGDFAYVGSRTDGSKGHLRPGILVVNVKESAEPERRGRDRASARG